MKSFHYQWDKCKCGDPNNSQPFTTFRVLGPCHYHIKSVAEMRLERQVLVVIVCTTRGNSMHQPTPSSNSMHSTSNSANSTSNSIRQPTPGLLSACQCQRCPSNWQPLRFKAAFGGSGQWGCLTLHCVSSAFCLAQLTGDCFVRCFVLYIEFCEEFGNNCSLAITARHAW